MSRGSTRPLSPTSTRYSHSHNRDLEILVKRGSCYLRLNEPLKALDDFDRVTQHGTWASRVFGPAPILDTNNVWSSVPVPNLHFPESWGHRGVALLMLGRDEEALESFRTSVSLWNLPGNQPWNVLPQNRGKLLRSKAGSYEGFGQAYLRLGQTEQAFQMYSQAIAIDPTDPNGFAGRADVLAQLKLLDAADADYSEAIRLDSDAFTGLLRERHRSLRPGPRRTRPGRLRPGDRARSDIRQGLLVPRQHARPARAERAGAG